MANTGHPETVGRVQQPRTLPSDRSNDVRGEDKYYLGSEGYDEKEDEGAEYARMREEALTRGVHLQKLVFFLSPIYLFWVYFLNVCIKTK